MLERGLSKLNISAWKDREGKIPAGNLCVDFNPDTISMDYRARFAVNDALNKSAQSNHYLYSEPVGLSLELIFDGRSMGHADQVEAQLEKLRSMCLMDSATEEPRFLKVTWGKMRWGKKNYFAGRASSLSVVYTLFDRNAKPLRAKAEICLVADESFHVQNAEHHLSAPTEVLISVDDQSPLPLLALSAGKHINQNVHYLDLAWDNDLDHLDQMVCGDHLYANKKSEA